MNIILLIVTIFLSIFAILLLASLAYLGWLYYHKRKYTREKFAFILAANYTSIIILALSYVVKNDIYSTIVNYFLKNVFSLPEIQFGEPDFRDNFIAFILLFMYFYFTNRLYKEWNGGKSIHEVGNLFNAQELSIFLDAYNFYINEDSKILATKTNTERNKSDSPIDVKPVEKVVWHKQAAKLLRLTDSQYKIDDKDDWYSQENCYISKYGKDGQVLAILCSLHEIADDKLSAFILFVKGQKKATDDIRFIWAIQEDISISIKKIDGVDIELVTEKKLLDELVDFSDYKRYITKIYENEQISVGYPLTIKDIYVEPTCTTYNIDNKETKEIASIEKYIFNWLNDDSQHKQLAILGEYGMGKSVLSQRLAYRLLNKIEVESKRIPIIIELRGRYIKQYQDTNEILNLWAMSFNINPLALQELHSAGRLLLIFEGFDELELTGDKQIRKEHFRKLWEFSIPNSKIIITGRPNYFISDNEMKALLRLGQKQAEGSIYCETINLCRFSFEQIKSAMRQIEKHVREEIINVYTKQAKDSSFVDLVSRPSLLFLTGLIWEKENLSQKIDNINSADVIKAFLNNCYKRQDEKDDKNKKAIMISEERAYFMQGVAIALVKHHGYTNQISAEELEKIIEKLLQTFPDAITRNSVNAEQTPLKERLDKEHLMPTIYTDIRSCGVLVKDLSKENTFRFAHKSFLEVLVAEFIANSFLMKEKSTDIHYIKVMTISKTLEIKLDYLEVSNDNISKFIVELMSANIKIKREETPKDIINNIYRQLHLFPFPLRSLGWIVGVFGPSMLFSATFLILFISNILYMLFMMYNFYFMSLATNVKVFFVVICMIMNTVFFILFINRYRSIRRRLRYRVSGIKVILFFLICKDFHVESVLQQIWPSFAYRLVERLANQFKKQTED